MYTIYVKWSIIHVCMYEYAFVLEVAAPTVFMFWLRAYAFFSKLTHQVTENNY